MLESASQIRKRASVTVEVKFVVVNSVVKVCQLEPRSKVTPANP